jgi:hypothetical protein
MGAVDRFQSRDFDLVLLCHSVPRKDRGRLTGLIRASGSHTPIVSIAGNLSECDTFATATLEDGPSNFLAGIKDVLERWDAPPYTSELRTSRKVRGLAVSSPK